MSLWQTPTLSLVSSPFSIGGIRALVDYRPGSHESPECLDLGRSSLKKIARRTTGAKGFYPVHNIDTPLNCENFIHALFIH